ncbi:hypothetical protein CBS11350_1868 [Aspergillus niger]|nr:hypothetical protein CBS11350_1868 [Aspergillus niger]
MYPKNFGLLATAFLAATVSALPRTVQPHQDGLAASIVTLDQSPEGGDLMQRSEAETATGDGADWEIPHAHPRLPYYSGSDNGGNKGVLQRSEANTATNDNEDLMYSVRGDDGDVPPQNGWGRGNVKRSEANTATNDNEDFMFNATGDDDVPHWHGRGRGNVKRSEAETASKDNAEFWPGGRYGGYGGYSGNDGGLGAYQ